MKIVKKIERKGWPVYTKSGKISQKWKKAHPAANRYVLKKYGPKVAKAVNKIKVPKTELLGSHTKRGRYTVSSRVKQVKSKKMRKLVIKAILDHEKREHRIMTKKSRK